MPVLSLKQIASVDWGNTIQWHFEFEQKYAPSAPFDKFVPAQTIEMPHGSVVDHTIEIGNHSANIPLGSEAEQMTVTFVDDVNDTMLRYFEQWMYDLTHDGTATLLEAIRSALYYKTDRQGDFNHSYAIEFYPTGELSSTMGETSDSRIVSVTFNVVSKKIS